MRCLCCNKILTDPELKKKYSDGSFVDTCYNCRALGFHQFGYYDLVDGTMGDEVGEMLTRAMQNHE
jgi:hypothetical protein